MCRRPGEAVLPGPERGLRGKKWFLKTDGHESDWLLISRANSKMGESAPSWYGSKWILVEDRKGMKPMSGQGIISVTWAPGVTWFPFMESNVSAKLSVPLSGEGNRLKTPLHLRVPTPETANGVSEIYNYPNIIPVVAHTNFSLGCCRVNGNSMARILTWPLSACPLCTCNARRCRLAHVWAISYYWLYIKSSSTLCSGAVGLWSSRETWRQSAAGCMQTCPEADGILALDLPPRK